MTTNAQLYRLVTSGKNVAVYTYVTKNGRGINGGVVDKDGWYHIWSNVIEPMEIADFNAKFPDYYTTEDIAKCDQLCDHVTSLKNIREEIRSYLDTGYEADIEISNVICGKIDNEIKAISDPVIG